MRRLTALAATLAFLPAAASAATIVDTGEGRSPDARAIYAYQRLAAKFTLNSATTIDTIKGFVRGYAGSINGVLKIGIAADKGDIPGEELFSTSLTTSATPGWQGNSDLGWTLAAGSYWVTFANDAGSTLMFYDPASPAADEAIWNGNPWKGNDNLNLSFQIFSADAVAAVPEPASWALTIMGFGLLGGAMRRRNPAYA
jgi:hypothetical protein